MQRLNRVGGKAQDLGFGLEGKPLGDGEFGDSVDQGPGYARQCQRIAARQAAFALRGFHQSNQHRESTPDLHQLLAGEVGGEFHRWVPVLSSKYSLPASDGTGSPAAIQSSM